MTPLVVFTLAVLAALAWVLDPVFRGGRPASRVAGACVPCGASLRPGAAFCSACGAPVEPNAPPPPDD